MQENKKICAHNYSRTTVYFKKFSVVLENFLKVYCAKHLLVTTASFLSNYASTLALGIFSVSENIKILKKCLKNT